MTHLASPGFLALLLIIPIYWLCYLLYYLPRRPYMRLSIDPVAAGSVAKSYLPYLQYIPILLIQIAFVCGVIALARPQTTQGFTAGQVEGTDIMLLFDISGSMNNQDVLPDRLSVAKQAAQNFIEARKTDRFGVVVFAQDAFCFVPLTLDHAFVRRQISEISTDLMQNDGTAIGSALAAGINHLRNEKSKTQSIILLTDGASNTGRLDPITAARLAEQFNVRVYTVAIGLPEISETTDSTTKKSLLRTQANPKIKSDVDENTLQKVADLSRGSFFRASSGGSLDNIFKQIDRMEKSPYPIEQYRMAVDLYPPYLIFALFCLLIASLLQYFYFYNPLED